MLFAEDLSDEGLDVGVFEADIGLDDLLVALEDHYFGHRPEEAVQEVEELIPCDPARVLEPEHVHNRLQEDLVGALGEHQQGAVDLARVNPFCVSPQLHSCLVSNT